MEDILRVRDLTKRFKDKAAVDHVNIDVKKGEIYGFLGKNGAGKTTTMRMILGLIRPTSGSIELFGESVSPGRYRHGDRIGSIIETPGFYPNLTGAENLEIHRRLIGETDKGAITAALHKVGLAAAEKKLVKNYSMGMKQRLGIARAILHGPELLVLDEPNNNLDPEGIRQMRSLFRSMARDYKVSIFISSHILSEIEQTADRICIIDQGRIVEAIDTETMRMNNRKYLRLQVSDDRKTALILEKELDIHDMQIPEPGSVCVYERWDDSALIVRTLVTHGVDVMENSVMKDSLENYFLSRTGETYHE